MSRVLPGQSRQYLWPLEMSSIIKLIKLCKDIKRIDDLMIYIDDKDKKEKFYYHFNCLVF